MMLVLGVVAVELFALDRGMFRALRTRDAEHWAIREWWGKKKEFTARFGTTCPKYLFVGDSTMSIGFRPSAVDASAFDLARSGLTVWELPELTTKIEQLTPRAPKTLFISVAIENFREDPAGKPAWYDLYTDQNWTQRALFPGMRLAKFSLKQVIAQDAEDPRYFIDKDGAMRWRFLKRPPEEARDFGYSWLERPAGFLQARNLEPLAEFRRHWLARGSNVVFVFMPLEPEFRKEFFRVFAADHARYKKDIGEMFAGQVVDLEGEWPSEDFLDGTHLNDVGAIAIIDAFKRGAQPYL